MSGVRYQPVATDEEPPRVSAGVRYQPVATNEEPPRGSAGVRYSATTAEPSRAMGVAYQAVSTDEDRLAGVRYQPVATEEEPPLEARDCRISLAPDEAEGKVVEEVFHPRLRCLSTLLLMNFIVLVFVVPTSAYLSLPRYSAGCDGSPQPRHVNGRSLLGDDIVDDKFLACLNDILLSTNVASMPDEKVALCRTIANKRAASNRKEAIARFHKFVSRIPSINRDLDRHSDGNGHARTEDEEEEAADSTKQDRASGMHETEHRSHSDVDVGWSDPSQCMVRAQSHITLMFAIILLVFLKLVGFPNLRALCAQMIGSTNATKRDCPAALLFRLVAVWSFWGMMLALAMAVQKQEPHFTERTFLAMRGHGDDGIYLVRTRDGKAALTAEGLPEENCAAFESYGDIRRFSFWAIGAIESVVFLLGAFFFGLGELFKLDTSQGYLLQGCVDLDVIAFFNMAFVGDRLLQRYDSLIGKLTGFTKQYGADIDQLQADLTNLEGLSMESFKGPAHQYEAFAKKQALAKLRPYLEPKLQKQRLTWNDMVPILEELDSSEDLMQAVQDPHKFIKELAGTTKGIAKQAIVARLRPKIDPALKVYELVWEDVAPVIDEFDSVEEVQDALSDPELFIHRLGQAYSPLARKATLKALKGLLSLKLKEHDLVWADVADDVSRILEQLDSIPELQAIPSEPMKFLEKLRIPIARKVALKALKPKLEPQLKGEGLDWSDALTLFDEIDSVEEVEGAAKDPAVFLENLKSKGSVLDRKVTIAKLKPCMTRALQKQSLEWDDVAGILGMVDSLAELQEARKDPEQFLQCLGKKSKPIALKWTLINIRPTVEPRLKEAKLEWTDVVSILQKVDSPEELETAKSDPIAFLRKWLPQKKKVDVAREDEEVKKSCNQKEEQKVVWPAVLQASAAALWISAAYVDIDPCVNWGSVQASILFGLYDLDEGMSFLEFVSYTHTAMLCIVISLLLVMAMAGRCGCLQFQKHLVVFAVLVLVTYTVVLSTYESPKAGKLVTTTGIPGTALDKARAIAQGILRSAEGVPLLLVAAIGYAAEAAIRVVASRLSTPSLEEQKAYRNQRCKLVKEKATRIAELAPPALKASARLFTYRIHRHANLAVAKRVRDASDPGEQSMWMASLTDEQSKINRIVQEQEKIQQDQKKNEAAEAEAKRKAEAEAKAAPK